MDSVLRVNISALRGNSTHAKVINCFCTEFINMIYRNIYQLVRFSQSLSLVNQMSKNYIALKILRKSYNLSALIIVSSPTCPVYMHLTKVALFFSISPFFH